MLAIFAFSPLLAAKFSNGAKSSVTGVQLKPSPFLGGYVHRSCSYLEAVLLVLGTELLRFPLS